MNKKHLALIVAVIALIGVILAVVFFQSLTVNNASNATEKADSFEMQLKDYISGDSQITFYDYNIYNNTIKAEVAYGMTNYTKVSETIFLNDLGIGQGWENYESSITIFRIENTFYLNAYGEDGKTFQVQYSPSYSPPLSYSPTPSPIPSPTPMPEEAAITNIQFNPDYANSPDILLSSTYYNLTITEEDCAGSPIPVSFVTYTNPFNFVLSIGIDINTTGGTVSELLNNVTCLNTVLQTGLSSTSYITEVLPYQTINGVIFDYGVSSTYLDITYQHTNAINYPTILQYYPDLNQTIVSDSATLTIQNTGNTPVTITSAIVTSAIMNNYQPTITPPTLTINVGNTGTLTLTINNIGNFVKNTEYTFELTTNEGNRIVCAATYNGL